VLAAAASGMDGGSRRTGTTARATGSASDTRFKFKLAASKLLLRARLAADASSGTVVGGTWRQQSASRHSLSQPRLPCCG